MIYSCVSGGNLLDVLGPAVAIMAALFVFLAAAVVLVIKAIVFCKIFHKAGYHWAWGLLMLVPIACIIMPFVLAFGDWPIYRELRLLRQQSAKNAAK